MIQIGRYDKTMIHTITHELAHVFTLFPVETSTPGPLAVGHLYFNELISPPGLGGRACRPNELYADALSILVHGDGIVDQTNFWGKCELVTSAVSTEALSLVRSAIAGDMPSWFDETYDDSNGDPELERVWADVKFIHSWYYEDRVAALFQMKDLFGGYCSNTYAAESAVGDRVMRNPWKDGGCVPGAPSNVSATMTGYLWASVTWEVPVSDGGSPIKGYKIQWKRGTEEYDSSRQEVYTDLTFRDNRRFSIMQKTIWLSSYYQSSTIRVVPYNQNGDGTGTETTARPDRSDGTDPDAPQLLRAQRFHYPSSGIRLIYNEPLDDSSEPARVPLSPSMSMVWLLNAQDCNQQSGTRSIELTSCPSPLRGLEE